MADEPVPDEVRSSVLEDEEGDEYVIAQQNTGAESESGGGEWPDPDAEPSAPAPGSADTDTDTH